ncbi:hypothetical protein NESM_000080100 [Novymonas esmeraldas]|uniref:Uncharacterized protein n=1 Tax=Novymonas esmeraldas TaxID=1808958 RepID=A0AAW0F524_9TRYP
MFASDTLPLPAPALTEAAVPANHGDASSTSLSAPPQQRASLLPRFSVTAASSLRPARVKAATGAEAAAHPLLDELLRTATPPEEVAAPRRVDVTVADAVTVLGGTDIVEVLLVRLHDAAHAADAADAAVFGDTVAASVQEVLGVPALLLCTDEALTAGELSGEDDDERAARRRDWVSVAIPLPTAAAAAAAATPARDDSSGRRPCLLLRVQRSRGVLALRIVNIRFDGEVGRWHRGHRLVVADHQHPSQRGPGKLKQQQGQRRTAALPTRVSKDAGGGPSPLSPPRDASVAVAADTHAPVPAASVGTAPATDTTRRRERSSRRRQRAAAATAVPFDPLRPEQTTPFHSLNRPLTYNATITTGAHPS